MKITYDKELAQKIATEERKNIYIWPIYISFILFAIFAVGVIFAAITTAIELWIPGLGAAISLFLCWLFSTLYNESPSFSTLYFNADESLHILETYYKSSTNPPRASSMIEMCITYEHNGVVEERTLGCIPCKENINVSEITLNVNRGVLYIPYTPRINI